MSHDGSRANYEAVETDRNCDNHDDAAGKFRLTADELLGNTEQRGREELLTAVSTPTEAAICYPTGGHEMR